MIFNTQFGFSIKGPVQGHISASENVQDEVCSYKFGGLVAPSQINVWASSPPGIGVPDNYCTPALAFENPSSVSNRCFFHIPVIPQIRMTTDYSWIPTSILM